MAFRTFRMLASIALSAAVLYGATAAVTAAIRPPKLDYQVTTLANGLTLVTQEDHSTPIVHLQLWYHVGSRNEKPGRTGFAHLFEHLMFKGSKNVDPEGHTSMIASVGGQSNAYTHRRRDGVLGNGCPPSSCRWCCGSKPIGWRRCGSTRTRSTNEREVVKEERRMRVDNQPFGRLSEIIYDQAFTAHPYKHPTIGSMEDLEAASIDDVRDFYQTYYVPENATLALVGDFDTAQADAAGDAVSGTRAEGRARRFRATSRRSRRRRAKSA